MVLMITNLITESETETATLDQIREHISRKTGIPLKEFKSRTVKRDLENLFWTTKTGKFKVKLI